jgi:hypothetical protein
MEEVSLHPTPGSLLRYAPIIPMVTSNELNGMDQVIGSVSGREELLNRKEVN